MLHIACNTIDFQRIAARHRRWHAAMFLGVLGAGVPALLLRLTFDALHNGHSGAAGVLALLALLAGVVAGLATRASLAELGWAGLIKHCLMLARRAAAGRARASMLALARARNCAFCIASRQSKLIQVVTLVIIVNRLLPSVCISPRITAQRPN